MPLNHLPRYHDINSRDILFPLKIKNPENIEFNFCNSTKDKVKLVNTVFTWNFGGKNVTMVGDWDNWKKPIPLVNSGNEFSAILPLVLGKYQYKFTVDGEWKCSPINQVYQEKGGNINNLVKVSLANISNRENLSFNNYSESLLNDNLNYNSQGNNGPPWHPPIVPTHLGGFMISLESLRTNFHGTTSQTHYASLSSRIILNRIIFLNFFLSPFFWFKIPLFKLRIDRKYFVISSFSVVPYESVDNINPIKHYFFM
mmetsp:Transcript_23786/g.37191  ORF Transcript_23786/g.37191 Transcript_23786/m.37191 type:complete len:256 (-) Transcript_23786:651-1418(-)